MEREEAEASLTHSGSQKKGVGKAAERVKSLLKRRPSKGGINSERGTGSASSLENVTTEPPKGRFSLRRHRSRKQEKELLHKGAVTDRPRRSMSEGHIEGIEADDDESDIKHPLEPLEKEVKVPAFAEETEQFVRTLYPSNEGLIPPETPVPEQRGQRVGVQETRSSSSANVSEELPDVTFDDVTDSIEKERESGEVAVQEQIPEIEDLANAPSDYTPDADATIDAQIEKTVMESLVGTKEDELSQNEKEATDEPLQGVTDALTKVEAAEQPGVTDALTKFEAAEQSVVADAPAKVEAEVEIPKPVLDDVTGMTQKTRGLDLEDLVPKAEENVATPTEVPAAAVAAAPEPPAKKTKRRGRKFIFIKTASVSLASLAVGLLVMIIKNKN